MAEINRCGAALLPLAVALIGCSLLVAGAVTGGGSARRLLVDNWLARTPQMGWNSWNHFGCDINETVIRSTVDALVSSGLANAGYTYVNLGRGYMDVATWGGSYGNSWRTTGDINDTWASILNNIDQNDAYAKYAKPGGWNDPDMLEVGNGGLTHDEYIVHFSLWAIAKAPLIIGCDVTGISKETLGILFNPEVIAINQDRFGIQGRRVRKYDDEIEVWAGRLSGHRKAVLLLNRGATSRRSITATWADVALRRDMAAEARDVWKHETLPGRFAGRLTAEVGPHSCKLFILTTVGR
ncbi:hypothetical protein ACQ4PT_002711 [Festuca glaucescens]